MHEHLLGKHQTDGVSSLQLHIEMLGCNTLSRCKHRMQRQNACEAATVQKDHWKQACQTSATVTHHPTLHAFKGLWAHEIDALQRLNSWLAACSRKMHKAVHATMHKLLQDCSMQKRTLSCKMLLFANLYASATISWPGTYTSSTSKTTGLLGGTLGRPGPDERPLGKARLPERTECPSGSQQINSNWRQEQKSSILLDVLIDKLH